ncbi:MAG TPA: SGNH/GDSL hydrolase family protein [Kineosporiaceae bacterium]|nr:SGNH/GDSL hydrolase family protein [Kineosporiaceae bacterium]
MTRASSARRIAAAAVYGGGGLAGLGIAGLGVLMAEAKLARRAIGRPFGTVGPDGSGRYGDGTGAPVELAMLGDSSAVGLGVKDVRHTPGAVLAGGLAALSRRPVRLTVAAVVGADSRGLDAQIDRLFLRTPAPHAAVIMIGANDITHRLKPSDSVRALDRAVRRLRERGTQVVVGTCPDLGTVEPIPQPLRYLARRWSRQLAAAQTVAVVEAGGRTVSLGDLLGPEFSSRPREMFSDDGFHPSAAGYAQAAAALLPSVCAALELLPGELAAQRPDVRAGEGLDDVAHAAARAVAEPGTEVAGTEIAGSTRGPRGRWAVLLHRRRPRLPLRGEPAEEPARQVVGSVVTGG